MPGKGPAAGEGATRAGAARLFATAEEVAQVLDAVPEGAPGQQPATEHAEAGDEAWHTFPRAEADGERRGQAAGQEAGADGRAQVQRGRLRAWRWRGVMAAAARGARRPLDPALAGRAGHVPSRTEWCISGVYPFARALVMVGGVSTFTSSCLSPNFGGPYPHMVQGHSRSRCQSHASLGLAMCVMIDPAGTFPSTACHPCRKAEPRIRSLWSAASMSRGVRGTCTSPTGAAQVMNALSASRRHVPQGRCPAANAVASSRKNSSV